MEIEKAESLLKELFYKHVPQEITYGLRPWALLITEFESSDFKDFGFLTKKQRTEELAVCIHTHRVLMISAFIVRHAPDDLLRNIMLHEIAHAIAGPRAKHGKKWKAIARQIGCTNLKVYDDLRWITPEISDAILDECDPIPRPILNYCQGPILLYAARFVLSNPRSCQYKACRFAD
jgi:hypothetical protein